jgi:hypothetical protein
VGVLQEKSQRLLAFRYVRIVLALRKLTSVVRTLLI